MIVAWESVSIGVKMSVGRLSVKLHGDLGQGFLNTTVGHQGRASGLLLN